jgi:hypothetical protein
LFRLIGVPALAFASVLIYRGVQERFTLPDAVLARQTTVTGVLDQLKLGPLREGVKTISGKTSSSATSRCRRRQCDQHRVHIFLARQHGRHALFDLAQAGAKPAGHAAATSAAEVSHDVVIVRHMDGDRRMRVRVASEAQKRAALQSRGLRLFRHF